jgi:Na+-driven multidrug efflux pump
MSFGYGFGAAVLTLVGMAAGAGRLDRMQAFVTRAAALAVVVLGIPGLLVCWQPGLWLGLFTNDAGILAVGTQYFRIIGPTYPLVGITMVVAFAFQGLGRATVPLPLTIVRVAGVLVVAILCTHRFGLGEASVFATIAAGNLVSAAGLAALFGVIARRLRTGVPARNVPGELTATARATNG